MYSRSPSHRLRSVPAPTIRGRERRAIVAVVALGVVVHVGCGPAAVRASRVLARTGAAVVSAESTYCECHAAILAPGPRARRTQDPEAVAAVRTSVPSIG